MATLKVGITQEKCVKLGAERKEEISSLKAVCRKSYHDVVSLRK